MRSRNECRLNTRDGAASSRAHARAPLGVALSHHRASHPKIASTVDDGDNVRCRGGETKQLPTEERDPLDRHPIASTILAGYRGYRGYRVARDEFAYAPR